LVKKAVIKLYIGMNY